MEKLENFIKKLSIRTKAHDDNDDKVNEDARNCHVV